MGTKCHHVLVHFAGCWAAIHLHHLIKNVVQQHGCIPPNDRRGGGWGDLERIIDVGAKCVIHGMVNVACCVVVILLAGEGGSDIKRLLSCVWDDSSVIRS
jgi:hypothetical protein